MPKKPAGARTERRPKPPPAVPTEALLQEAALAHLARFGTTRAQLARVLERRIERWARAAEADPSDIATIRARARAAVMAVVERLAASGAVNDEAFAASRARRLVRSGRSRRAVAAHLAARGIGAEDAEAALAGAVPGGGAFGDEGSKDGGSGDGGDLAAALATARRRRAGPFRAGDADDAVRRRELAALARAGFSRDVASRALSMDHDAAQAMVERLKRG